MSRNQAPALSRTRAAKEYLYALSTPVSLTVAGLLALVPRRRPRSERLARKA
jgi:hypothetical protein